MSAAPTARLGPFEAVADGVRVTVRLTPKASRNAVTGIQETVDGRRALKVSVTAVPEAGRANEALVKLLAKEWHLAKTSLTVIAGATDRNKTLHIAGDPADLLTRLSGWADIQPS